MECEKYPTLDAHSAGSCAARYVFCGGDPPPEYSMEGTGKDVKYLGCLPTKLGKWPRDFQFTCQQ